jgi:hypothetical protein
MDPMMGGMDPMMGGMDPMMGGMDPNMMGGMMGMDPMMGGMMGMDPMMGGMDPMMGMGMDPGMGQMGQMMQMGMDMNMGMGDMMQMGMDMGMNMNPMEGMMGEMGGMMGMDPGMGQMGMDPGMGQMGFDPGMGQMGFDPGMGQMGFDPGMGNDPGQMYGNEFMNPGENMMPGQNNQMFGNNNIMENNMPGQNQNDPEEQGFMGEMWNGVFYGPGQELALQQAQIAYPNGYMNGGQGENFGGGGSMVRMASPGQDTLMGQSNVQDTFVFNLSEANGFGSPEDPATIMNNAFGGDIIMDFDPADGDKIKIMDGGNALTPADAAGMLSVASNGVMYATYISGTSGVLFSSTQVELSNVLESNFTDV